MAWIQSYSNEHCQVISLECVYISSPVYISLKDNQPSMLHNFFISSVFPPKSPN